MYVEVDSNAIYMNENLIRKRKWRVIFIAKTLNRPTSYNTKLKIDLPLARQNSQ